MHKLTEDFVACLTQSKGAMDWAHHPPGQPHLKTDDPVFWCTREYEVFDHAKLADWAVQWLTNNGHNTERKLAEAMAEQVIRTLLKKGWLPNSQQAPAA